MLPVFFFLFSLSTFEHYHVDPLGSQSLFFRYKSCFTAQPSPPLTQLALTHPLSGKDIPALYTDPPYLAYNPSYHTIFLHQPHTSCSFSFPAPCGFFSASSCNDRTKPVIDRASFHQPSGIRCPPQRNQSFLQNRLSQFTKCITALCMAKLCADKVLRTIPEHSVCPYPRLGRRPLRLLSPRGDFVRRDTVDVEKARKRKDGASDS